MAPPGVGFTFTPDRRIGDLPRVAREAEELGFDQLWLWEDCFLSGGIATSATALAAGTTITVGLGIMPAVFRNVAATAMEVATLANLYPGRFLAGLGHGMAGWMDQIGALPERPVRQLEEATVALRALLAGGCVTQHGDYVRLRDVQLAMPPPEPPPVLLGVRRPFGLRASGRSADGTILAEPTPPAYLRAAREQIDRGRAAATGTCWWRSCAPASTPTARRSVRPSPPTCCGRRPMSLSSRSDASRSWPTCARWAIPRPSRARSRTTCSTRSLPAAMRSG